MKKLFTLCFLAISLSLYGQFDHENVTMLGRFDDDSLEKHAFGYFHDVWGYVANGHEYGIITSKYFVHIIDVTDPPNLIEVARVEIAEPASWRDVKVFQDHLYVSSDKTTEGITIIDLSNLPVSAPIVNTLKDQFLECHNIYIEVATGRLYSAGAGTSGTYVWDLNADPANPTFIGHADFGGIYVHDIYVRDNIAYASAGNDGYYIYNVTDPANAIYKASVETQGYNHSSWVSEDGSFAIFAEEVPLGLPLGIMELDDLENGDIAVNNYFQFPLIETTGTQSTPHNPYIKGRYAYVSYYHDGLMVFDLCDPTDPQRVGYFDAFPANVDYEGYRGTWGCYPYLPSGNILISDLENGLFVLDFELDGPNEVPCITATNDIESIENKIALFPNPAANTVRIETGLQLTSPVRIYNQLGRLVMSIEQKSLNARIDISDLNTGVYTLDFETEDGAVAKRLVKQ